MQANNSSSADAKAQLARTETYLASDPANTELLARAVDLGLAAGDLQAAQRHVHAALAAHPGDPYFLYRHGHVLAGQRRWQEAADVFRALLAGRDDLQLAASLASCLSFLGAHAEVITLLAPFADAEQLPADAAVALVRAWHHAGEPDAALAFAARRNASFGGNASFLAAASLASLDAGDVEQAAALSEAALASDARPVEALVASASVALALADGARATARFEEVLARNPEEGRSWSGLGMASALGGDFGAAIAQLEQAVRFMPGHIGTWHMLGWCRLFAQDIDGGAAAFDQALALDRNFGESHGAVAVAAALRGQHDGARAAIARAERLDRDGLSARYARMVLSGEAADPQRLQATLDQAVGTRPGAFGMTLGEIIRRQTSR